MTSKKSPGNTPTGKSKVRIQNRQRRYKLSPAAVRAFCSGILSLLGESPRALSVLFVGPRSMQRLNSKFRAKNYPTDVLSFSYGREETDGLPFLGEVVIAPEIARLQARRWNTAPEKEMRKLLAHGILHLLGYDHETDSGEMNRLQERLIRSQVFREAGAVLRPRVRV